MQQRKFPRVHIDCGDGARELAEDLNAVRAVCQTGDKLWPQLASASEQLESFSHGQARFDLKTYQDLKALCQQSINAVRSSAALWETSLKLFASMLTMEATKETSFAEMQKLTRNSVIWLAERLRRAFEAADMLEGHWLVQCDTQIEIRTAPNGYLDKADNHLQVLPLGES